MFQRIFVSTLAIVALVNASVVSAQSDITAWYNNHVAQQNHHFQQIEQQLTRQNMQDPQVQQMYGQYQSNGGQGSFEQFAFGYAATGGYTPRGWNHWHQSQTQIQNRDRQSVADYHNHVNRLWAETNDYRRNVQDRIAYHRGELLSGNGTYVDPFTGQHQQLPYTSETGTWHTDYYGYQQFQMDSFGNYWMRNPQTGLWYQMGRY
jgi:hypothetical protein